jgi:hypothetical protein
VQSLVFSRVEDSRLVGPRARHDMHPSNCCTSSWQRSSTPSDLLDPHARVLPSSHFQVICSQSQRPRLAVCDVQLFRHRVRASLLLRSAALAPTRAGRKMRALSPRHRSRHVQVRWPGHVHAMIVSPSPSCKWLYIETSYIAGCDSGFDFIRGRSVEHAGRYNCAGGASDHGIFSAHPGRPRPLCTPG